VSKLNPVAQKWVEALRSGEYKQASQALRENDGFCCLGVLCDLAGKHGLGEWEQDTWFLGCGASVPVEVRQWSGLKTSYGTLGNRTLAEMNDDGATFAEIADLIEQHADELFVEAQP